MRRGEEGACGLRHFERVIASVRAENYAAMRYRYVLLPDVSSSAIFCSVSSWRLIPTQLVGHFSGLLSFKNHPSVKFPLRNLNTFLIIDITKNLCKCAAKRCFLQVLISHFYMFYTPDFAEGGLLERS
ncbi:hypothetical protein ACQ4WY_18765 [Janthinobacterium sp. LB2P49]|uniref:hypothetical protein n=1 Tax=Janthinobacterium sp. LB2P49 TaxID=3424198 RepID=UPI003F299ED1